MKGRRLLRLANVLLEDAKNKKGITFNMGIWGGPTDTFRNRWDHQPNTLPEVNCGTSACAMGLAVLSHEFDKEGLYATYSGNGFGGYTLTPIIIDPKFGDKHVDFAAAQVLFNIKDYEAEFLFGPAFYPKTKRHGAAAERYVAKRIKAFVAAGKVPRNVRNSYDLNQRYNY